MAIGGAVAPHLVIHGEVLTLIAVEPTVYIDGEAFPTSDASMHANGLGAGVVYYFMPSELYLGGALLMVYLDTRLGGDVTGNTEWGPAFVARLGKEFRLSPLWSIGVGGEFLGASVKPREADITTQFSALSGVFRATFR